MKHVKSLIIAVSVMVGGFLSAPINAQAGWELYEDFSSGAIDPVRWDVLTTGGTVTVVNGRAKLAHNDPTGRINLFLKDPQSIKGVKVRIRVLKASGDLSVRIGGFVAFTRENNLVFQVMELRNNSGIQAFLEVQDPATYETIYTLFSNKFINPTDMIGKWFRISATYPTPDKYVYSSSGQGTCTFKLPTGTLVDGKTVLYIGTKSKDDTATGTVYFDDVYVFK